MIRSRVLDVHDTSLGSGLLPSLPYFSCIRDNATFISWVEDTLDYICDWVCIFVFLFWYLCSLVDLLDVHFCIVVPLSIFSLWYRDFVPLSSLIFVVYRCCVLLSGFLLIDDFV